MTAVLAIDTADRTAGAAVAVDGYVVAEATENAGSLHSGRIWRLVSSVLGGAGVAKEDLAAVAVSRGPGSFTGLRVGVATAKGIAFALRIPAAGVSTLEAMARAAMPFPGPVCPVLDARKQQVYAGAWDGVTGETLLPEAAWAPSHLSSRLEGLPSPRLLLGSGLGPYEGVFRSAERGVFLFAGSARWPVPPGQVAVLGYQEVIAGRAEDPALLKAVYHRVSEAEEKKRGLSGGPGDQSLRS